MSIVSLRLVITDTGLFIFSTKYDGKLERMKQRKNFKILFSLSNIPRLPTRTSWRRFIYLYEWHWPSHHCNGEHFSLIITNFFWNWFGWYDIILTGARNMTYNWSDILCFARAIRSYGHWKWWLFRLRLIWWGVCE